ncbi:hypothetical protein GYMLUDRAFT_75554 [Collybiopsis luxurians FD-317 M1]|uniref:DUF6729 domain-containing protein n=1 Tax=Collybiopsis luxurians FD-317 M1 TaxID=944289 RepID=A0A0D0C4H8_9AGAR|nr:hypothetical protein GYMLUDRAFT_75554 [Collybiopsis luxurians FD-317 M1]
MNITTPDSYLSDASLRKRRPGRPKGSGVKKRDNPKVKRPVGRPRRDGLPSGSVNFRPKRIVLEFDDDWSKLWQTNQDAFLSSLVLALSSLPPPASTGPSAEEAFKSHLKSLTPASGHNQHLPSLYSILKTFWLPTSPGYFSLTASTSARTLSDHRFFYWDPLPLTLNGMACPSCSAPLHNEGRINHGPLKIYDVERPFFVIGAEYVCKNERKSFASTDPSILRALPQKLRDELPAKLEHADKDIGSDEKMWCWKPAGVSKTLWNLVLGCVRAGLKKDVTVKLIRDAQKGVDLPDEEQTKAPDPDQGFADVYSTAWAANTATTNEEDGSMQQEPDGMQSPSPTPTPPPSYGPFTLTRSTNQMQTTPSFNSTSFRFANFDSSQTTSAPVANGISNNSMSRTLHNAVSPISSTQSQSSLNGAIVGNNPIADNSPRLQLLTPSTMTSRLSPISSAATPVLTASTASVPPASSSSAAQASSNSPQFSQAQQSPQPRAYDYPMTDYSEQQQQHQQLSQRLRPQLSQIQQSQLQQPQPQPQQPQSALQSQSQPQQPQSALQSQSQPQQTQMPIHNPYQQTHAGLALAAHTSNDPMSMIMNLPMANTAHSLRRNDTAATTNTSNGNSLSTLSTAAQVHRTTANIPPSSSSPPTLNAATPSTGISILQHIANHTSANAPTGTPQAPPPPPSAPAPLVVAPVPVTNGIAVAPAPAVPGSHHPVPIPNRTTSTSNSAPNSTSFISSQRQRTRNPRHCSKCGSTSCKGKGGRGYCTNACKDCGRFECRGRNSRRPDKTCDEGWG